ncbi:AAA family ATPase [Pollutimonas harenae]|uniref:AAA family ATPase n=1 Tax=Pollutimonas harenae TaxID=657015 RepID=A0A853H4H8_9BURK|nr:AAA family ATPase [Pollutimonas harenae]NYT85024.1 AAA family ATPase [Pollutimonas harenae]TEA72590.1 ATPase [Pollutimonas harenae]
MTTPDTSQTHDDLICVPPTAESLLSLRIKHTRIAELMTELETLIYPGSQDSLLLVCGPTGVGKSTLAHHAVQKALQTSAQAMADDAGLIPAVYVEAPSSGENEFSWRLFYSRILAQLDQGPVENLPRANFGIDAQSGRMIRPRSSSGTSLASLRTAVERGLAARGTQFLVIDEAAHIIRQTSARRLEIQLDTLKSLANACGAQMLLIGSYDLYQLMSLSGQLSRRTNVLQFERYRQDRPEDERDFNACVLQFEKRLQHLWGGKLVAHSAALHENTLGCIGTLSAVLTRTAKRLERAQGWSLDALRRSLLTEGQRLRILEEILDGESAINPGLTRKLPKASSVSTNAGRRVA